MEFVNVASIIFADTWHVVMYILGLIALIGGTAGVALYQILERHLRRESNALMERAEKRTNEVVSQRLNELDERVAYHTAYLYDYHSWVFADVVKAFMAINRLTAEGLREAMIGYAKQARTAADFLTEERYGEYKCVVYNNLAWNLADRANPPDREEAHQLVAYIAGQMAKYPAYEVDFRETTAYVLWRLPLELKEKREAQKIIKQLLQRTDISDEIKERWRLRYKLKPGK